MGTRRRHSPRYRWPQLLQVASDCLQLATCNLHAEVAFQNIKSLAFRPFCRHCALGEAVVACRKIYKSDNLIYHCTLSSNELGALGYSTHYIHTYILGTRRNMEYGI